MCGIAGIYGKESSKHIITMVNSLKYRGPDGKGLYINGQIFKSNDIDKEFTNILNSNFALGHNLLSIVGENRLQPLKFNNIILVSNAEIYNYKYLVKKYNLSYEDYYSDSEVLLELINYFYTGNLLEAVKKTINIIDADYAFCVYDGIDYIVVRDPVGVKPLYYSYDDDSFAFASEKVAIYNIGFSNIFDLNPRTYIFNGKINQFNHNNRNTLSFNDYDSAINEFKKFIVESVSKRVSGVDNIGLLFSGGVDSSLIASICKQLNVDVTLYTTGTKNSQDLNYAKKAAKSIDLPLKEYIINVDDVRKYALPVLEYIDDINLMKLGVGLTAFFTSKLASKDNIKVLLSGQGADELFAGYNRYKNKYDTPDKLEEELLHDLENIYHVNLERDDTVTMHNHMELRVPFLDKNIINFSKSIPLNYKINSSTDNIRKHILRDASLQLGVPEFIAYRPKKAAQYGSGIHKILIKKIIKESPYNELFSN